MPKLESPGSILTDFIELSRPLALGKLGQLRKEKGNGSSDELWKKDDVAMHEYIDDDRISLR